MRIDEFEFQDRNGNEIEPTKNQLVVYIKSLHKQIAELQKQLKSQPAEIVENIKKKIEKEKDKNDLAWLGFNKLDRILDEILQEYQKKEKCYE